jgi:chromosome segregation ATPase
VRIDGRDIAGLAAGKVAETVGTLFQEPRDSLFERTALREVAFGLRAGAPRRSRLARDDADARAREAGDAVGQVEDELARVEDELARLADEREALRARLSDARDAESAAREALGAVDERLDAAEERAASARKARRAARRR